MLHCCLFHALPSRTLRCHAGPCLAEPDLALKRCSITRASMPCRALPDPAERCSAEPHTTRPRPEIVIGAQSSVPCSAMPSPSPPHGAQPRNSNRCTIVHALPSPTSPRRAMPCKTWPGPAKLLRIPWQQLCNLAFNPAGKRAGPREQIGVLAPLIVREHSHIYVAQTIGQIA